MDDANANITVLDAFTSALEWWDEMGVDVPKTIAARPKARQQNTAREKSATSAQTSRSSKARSPQAAANTASFDTRLAAAKKMAASAKDVGALKTAMAGFDAGTLSDNATQCVFARGNPESRLMVIGEAPTHEEDASGRPFDGRSGQLLDRMLAAIGLTTDEFYASAIINWRPPGSRAATPEEIALCRPFLERHIELAAPDFLLITGGVALAAMTDLTGIMKNRGAWQTLKFGDRDIPALPIYHPAFLLKRPELKKEAWRDLLSLHARLNIDS